MVSKRERRVLELLQTTFPLSIPFDLLCHRYCTLDVDHEFKGQEGVLLQLSMLCKVTAAGKYPYLNGELLYGYAPIVGVWYPQYGMCDDNGLTVNPKDIITVDSPLSYLCRYRVVFLDPLLFAKKGGE